MKQNHTKETNSKKKLIIFLLLLLLIAVGWFLYKNFKEDTLVKPVETEGQTWNGKKKEQIDTNRESIAIPGYDTISLKSGTLYQSVNLYNPDLNNCYFKMSLILPDGIKVWESKLIEPGNGLYNIMLDKKIEPGEYENTILKYECFTLDENRSALNGSEIKLKLVVV